MITMINMKNMKNIKNKKWSAPMKKKYTASLLTGIMLVVLLFLAPPPVTATTPVQNAETAVIPGNVDQVSGYTNFFYNYPSGEFFYHLNDRLLFLDRPDEILTPNGYRNQLLNILRWHKVLKLSMKRAGMDEKNVITLDLTKPEGIEKTSVLLTLMGLRLTKTPEGTFQVAPGQGQGVIDYYTFVNLNPQELQARLNKTKQFRFEFRESEIPAPFKYEFLEAITGIKVDKNNFFETMLKNERFSLLLAVLHRLPEREITILDTLSKDAPHRVWKEIYGDRKFLMGVFYLVGALRFTDDGRFDCPGGNGAEKFWSDMTGENPAVTPLRFLYKLATQDDGKLNYLFLFSRFLPEKTQHMLFVENGGGNMKSLYRQIVLTDAEKLREDQFTGVADFSFYTFFYPFAIENNALYFPQGVGAWVRSFSRDGGADQPGRGSEFPANPGLQVSGKLTPETKIVLKSGETVKGRVSRIDGSSVVLAREVEISKDAIASMELPPAPKPVEEKPEIPAANAITAEKTGESESPVINTQAGTDPAVSPNAPKQTADGAFSFDNIDKDPNASKSAGEVADVFEKESSSVRIFGKFWPDNPIFLKVSMNYIQPLDAVYRENYGGSFYIPEFRVGVFFTTKLSVWFAYSSFKGKTVIDLTGLAADASQTISSYGFGYHMKLSKKLRCSLDLSIVNIQFVENALGLSADGSGSGFRLGLGIGMNLNKNFFTDINTYYMTAPTDLSPTISAKLGGFGAGFGLGFRL